MKKSYTPIIVVIVIVAAVIAIFGINSYYRNLAGQAAGPDDPDTCYFASADSQCAVTIFDYTAAKDLTSLKSIACSISTTGGYQECKHTLDINGDGVVTSIDVSILKDWTALKKVAANINGAPGAIELVSAPPYTDGVTSYDITLKVLTISGRPSVLMGVNVGAQRKFTDLNGLVTFTIPGNVNNIDALIHKSISKGIDNDITYSGCIPSLCSYPAECSEGPIDDGCAGTCTRDTDGNSCDGGAGTCQSGSCVALPPPPPVATKKAEYLLEELSGQVVADTSGNGFNGFLGSSDKNTQNDPERVSTNLGYGLNFIPFNYATLANGITPLNQFTFEALISQRTGTGGIYSDKQLNFSIVNNKLTILRAGVQFDSCTSDGDVVLRNGWAYVSATYYRSHIKLYINGELDKTCPAQSFSLPSDTQTERLGYGFDGKMDFLDVYEGAVSDQQIKDRYNEIYPVVVCPCNQVGQLLDSAVFAMAVYNNQLYAAPNSGFVYKYDGTSWVKAGTYPAASANSLAVYNDKLYAGVANGAVYVYDGSSWTLSGGYFSSGVGVNALKVYNNNLYVALTSGEVQRFDGSSWTQVRSAGQMPAPGGIEVYNSKLYIAQSDAFIYSYDGTSWTQVGQIGFIYDMEVYNNKLYVVSAIAVLDAFDGTSWSAIQGPPQSLTKLKTHGTKLYISGYGIISKYDGTSISSFGQLPAQVEYFEIFNGQLYAATNGVVPTGEGGVYLISG